jgi:hypothetical protein
MNRKLFFGAVFLCIAWAATSCEALGDCKLCRSVIYENGSVINSGTETEYCGVDLITIETQSPVISGNQTTKYECR